ncbi:Myb_DNA-binding domain-containing protein, partial [Cephalotus follicularis]
MNEAKKTQQQQQRSYSPIPASVSVLGYGGLNELELGEGSGDGDDGGGKSSKVRGPWSPEEDAVLTRLVGKFGARNWSMIARGIPGRSGKSCRLRWCNQLDPCLKRKPFTDEEDRIIISAHAVHGNKWAAIARLLPGRTDNSIKNHWNSTLRRSCIENGMHKTTPDGTEDGSLDRTKALSEETPSFGDINSFKPPEARDIKDVMMEYKSIQHEEKAQTNEVHFSAEPERSHPALSRPVALRSAFSAFKSLNGSTVGSGIPKNYPTQGPLVQASKSDFEICKFLDDVCGEPMVPLRCGHGCCLSPSGAHSQSSLLGPEFIEYEELPPFSSRELISIATDLNNISWIKSSLANSSAGMPGNPRNQRTYQGMTDYLQMDIVDQNVKDNSRHFEEGKSKLMDMMNEVMS